MAFLTAAQRRAGEAFGTLVWSNPFLPERLDAERQALEACGRRSVGDEPVWSRTVDFAVGRPNIAGLAEAAEALAADFSKRLKAGEPASPAELDAVANVAHYALYYRVQGSFLDAAEARPVSFRTLWETFKQGYDTLLAPAGEPITDIPPEHEFAVGFQMRRAFLRVYNGLYGTGTAAANLRAQVWHSIFTHNRRRYVATLYNRMRELPTLILGESGTGKEIVASAVAGSAYRAFNNEKCAFADECQVEAIHLAALPATLVEAELFGHRRGSFTGATADRPGRLESIGPAGCCFLDEIGDVDPSVQVKLLRVLQQRTFTRVGEAKQREFQGKLIAATHRDLGEMLEAGTFRSDLYYRLAADVVRTPPLRDLIGGDAGELRRLVGLVCRRLLGDEEHAAGLADEVLRAVDSPGGVGIGYGWPGNFRELEQCCRSVLVSGAYRPLGGGDAATAGDLTREIQDLHLTADELTQRYCDIAYRRLGSYEAVGRALSLDRRTVKAKLETLQDPSRQ